MAKAPELQIIEKLCDGISAISLPSDASEGTDLVQVRKTPESGYGLFAVRDIPRGTLIIDEEPLIMIPTVAEEETTRAFCEALDRCSETQLARIDRHSIDAVAWQAVSRGAIFRDIWEWCEAHRAVRAGDGQRRTRAEFRRAVEAVCRAYGIFFTNNLDTGRATGRGLFPLFSRMNHACRPTIHEHYDAAAGRLRVRTLRAVAAGEELHSAYIDLLAPRARRQRRLRQWGFDCRCRDACALGPAADALNDSAVDLDDMLGEYFWYKDNPPAGPPELDGRPDLADDVEAFHAGQDLVDTLVRLGLLGEPLFNAYRCCSKLAYDMGDLEEALRNAREALDVEVCCVGPDGTLAEPGEATTAWIQKLERELRQQPSQHPPRRREIGNPGRREESLGLVGKESRA